MTPLEIEMLAHVINNRDCLPKNTPGRFMESTEDTLSALMFHYRMGNDLPARCAKDLKNLNNYVISKRGKQAHGKDYLPSSTLPK